MFERGQLCLPCRVKAMSFFDAWKLSSAALLAYSAYTVVRWVATVYTSPLRRLRGPPSKSFLVGSVLQIRDCDEAVLDGSWVREYGKVMRIKTVLGVRPSRLSFGDSDSSNISDRIKPSSLLILVLSITYFHIHSTTRSQGDMLGINFSVMVGLLDYCIIACSNKQQLY